MSTMSFYVQFDVLYLIVLFFLENSLKLVITNLLGKDCLRCCENKKVH